MTITNGPSYPLAKPFIGTQEPLWIEEGSDIDKTIHPILNIDTTLAFVYLEEDIVISNFM